MLLAFRLILLPAAWWLANVWKNPWLLAGTTPPQFLSQSFLRWRPRSRRHSSSHAEEDDEKSEETAVKDDMDEEYGDGGSGEHGAVADSHAHNLIIGLLHSIERDTFAVNCVAIASAPGVLSPVISIAAFVTLVARPAVFSVCKMLASR